MTHIIGITGGNHQKIIPIVLHFLEQCVDCLMTELITLSLIKRIGFINKENTTQGRFDNIPGFDCSFTHIPADQIRPAGFNQFVRRQEPHCFINTAHKSGNCRLTGSGSTGKDHVQTLSFRLNTPFTLLFNIAGVIYQFGNILFDRIKTDQVVEFSQSGIQFIFRIGCFSCQFSDNCLINNSRHKIFPAAFPFLRVKGDNLFSLISCFTGVTEIFFSGAFQAVKVSCKHILCLRSKIQTVFLQAGFANFNQQC